MEGQGEQRKREGEGKKGRGNGEVGLLLPLQKFLQSQLKV